MTIVKAAFCLLAATVLGAAVLPSARADESNKKTIVTFSQAVEVPGKVLPAGTYTFQLMDSPSDRHIVQIFNPMEPRSSPLSWQSTTTGCNQPARR